MSTRQIASSTLWQLLSQLFMAALSVITVKLIVIGLSKELAGIYNVAYGYLQIFGIVADFGLYAISVRELSRAQDKAKVLSAFIVLRCIVLAIAIGSALAIVWLLPRWHGTPLPLAVTIAAFVPVFTLLSGLLRSVFQIHYKMHFVFIAEVTQRILTTAGTGWFIFYGMRLSNDPHSLYAFLIVGGVGALWLFLVSLFFAMRLMTIRLQTDWALVRHMLRLSTPYGVAFLCVALYRQMDLTMIALLAKENYGLGYEVQSAYYGFTRSITDMTYLIPTFLLNSSLPMIIQRFEQGEDTALLVGRTLLLTLLIGSISFLFCFFWARPLVLLLTSSRYLSLPGHPASDTVLKLLSFTTFLNSVVLFCFYSLLIKHEWRRLVTTMLVAVAISITLNVFLIPQLGFLGAGTTQTIVNIFLVVMLLPQTLRILPARFPLTFWLQWLGFSAVLGAGLYFSANLLTSPSRIIVGLIIAIVWMAMAGLIVRLRRTLM